jgi:ankyrin repeat protein
MPSHPPAALDKPALWTAAEGGHVKDVLQLLSIGANINERGFITRIHNTSGESKGYTPLHSAVYNKHVEVVQILLEHGADVLLKTTLEHLGRIRVPFVSYGHSALYIACAAFESTAQEAIMMALLKHGADVDAEDYSGQRPLSKAILHHSIPAIKLLLKHGADISLPNDDGENAIWWAISLHNHELSQESCRRFAKANPQHCSGNFVFDDVENLPRKLRMKEVIRTLLTHPIDAYQMIDALSGEKLIVSADIPPSDKLTKRTKARLRRQRRYCLNGPPDEFTSDEEILEMLRVARAQAEEARQDMLEAFTLGHHSRLGAASLILPVAPEVMQMILDRV